MIRFIVGRRSTQRREGQLRVTDRPPKRATIKGVEYVHWPGANSFRIVNGRVDEIIAIGGGRVVARVLPEETAAELDALEAEMDAAQLVVKRLSRRRQELLDGALPRARPVTLADADAAEAVGVKS